MAYGGVDVPAEGFDIHLWAVDPSGFLSGRDFPVIQKSDVVFVERLVKEKKVPEQHVVIAKKKTKIEFPKLASASSEDPGGSASVGSPVAPPLVMGGLLKPAGPSPPHPHLVSSPPESSDSATSTASGSRVAAEPKLGDGRRPSSAGTRRTAAAPVAPTGSDADIPPKSRAEPKVTGTKEESDDSDVSVVEEVPKSAKVVSTPSESSHTHTSRVGTSAAPRVPPRALQLSSAGGAGITPIGGASRSSVVATSPSSKAPPKRTRPDNSAVSPPNVVAASVIHEEFKDGDFESEEGGVGGSADRESGPSLGKSVMIALRNFAGGLTNLVPGFGRTRAPATSSSGSEGMVPHRVVPTRRTHVPPPASRSSSAGGAGIGGRSLSSTAPISPSSKANGKRTPSAVSPPIVEFEDGDSEEGGVDESAHIAAASSGSKPTPVSRVMGRIFGVTSEGSASASKPSTTAVSQEPVPSRFSISAMSKAFGGFGKRLGISGTKVSADPPAVTIGPSDGEVREVMKNQGVLQKFGIEFGEDYIASILRIFEAGIFEAVKSSHPNLVTEFETSLRDHAMGVCVGFLVQEANVVDHLAAEICSRKESPDWKKVALASYIYDSFNGMWSLNILTVRLYSIDEGFVGNSSTAKMPMWETFKNAQGVEFPADPLDVSFVPRGNDSVEKYCVSMLLHARATHEVAVQKCKSFTKRGTEKWNKYIQSVLTKKVKMFHPRTLSNHLKDTEKQPDSPRQYLISSGHAEHIPLLGLWPAVEVSRPVAFLMEQIQSQTIRPFFMGIISQTDSLLVDEWTQLRGKERQEKIRKLSTFFHELYIHACIGMLLDSNIVADVAWHVCRGNEPAWQPGREHIRGILDGSETLNSERVGVVIEKCGVVPSSVEIRDQEAIINAAHNLWEKIGQYYPKSSNDEEKYGELCSQFLQSEGGFADTVAARVCANNKEDSDENKLYSYIIDSFNGVHPLNVLAVKLFAIDSKMVSGISPKKEEPEGLWAKFRPKIEVIDSLEGDAGESVTSSVYVLRSAAVKRCGVGFIIILSRIDSIVIDKWKLINEQEKSLNEEFRAFFENQFRHVCRGMLMGSNLHTDELVDSVCDPRGSIEGDYVYDVLNGVQEFDRDTLASKLGQIPSSESTHVVVPEDVVLWSKFLSHWTLYSEKSETTVTKQSDQSSGPSEKLKFNPRSFVRADLDAAQIMYGEVFVKKFMSIFKDQDFELPADSSLSKVISSVCVGLLSSVSSIAPERVNLICDRKTRGRREWVDDALSKYIYGSFNDMWSLNLMAIELFVVQEGMGAKTRVVLPNHAPWYMFAKNIGVDIVVGLDDGLRVERSVNKADPVCVSLLANQRVQLSDAKRVCKAPMNKQLQEYIQGIVEGDSLYTPREARNLKKIHESTTPQEALLEMKYKPMKVMKMLGLGYAVVVTRPLVRLLKAKSGRVQEGFIRVISQVGSLVVDKWNELHRKPASDSTDVVDGLVTFFEETFKEACRGILKFYGIADTWHGPICDDPTGVAADHSTAREYIENVLNGSEQLSEDSLLAAIDSDPVGRGEHLYANDPDVELWLSIAPMLRVAEPTRSESSDRLIDSVRNGAPRKAQLRDRINEAITDEAFIRDVHYHYGEIYGTNILSIFKDEIVNEVARKVTGSKGKTTVEKELRSFVEYILSTVCSELLIDVVHMTWDAANGVCDNQSVSWANNALSSYIYGSFNGLWSLNLLAVKLFVVQEGLAGGTAVPDTRELSLWTEFEDKEGVRIVTGLNVGLDIPHGDPEPVCMSFLLNAGVVLDSARNACKTGDLKYVRRVVMCEEIFDPKKLRPYVVELPRIGSSEAPAEILREAGQNENEIRQLLSLRDAIVVTRTIETLRRSAGHRVKLPFIEVLSRMGSVLEKAWTREGGIPSFVSSTFEHTCMGMLAESRIVASRRSEVCQSKQPIGEAAANARDYVDSVLNLEATFDAHFLQELLGMAVLEPAHGADYQLWKSFQQAIDETEDPEPNSQDVNEGSEINESSSGGLSQTLPSHHGRTRTVPVSGDLSLESSEMVVVEDNYGARYVRRIVDVFGDSIAALVGSGGDHMESLLFHIHGVCRDLLIREGSIADVRATEICQGTGNGPDGIHLRTYIYGSFNGLWPMNVLAVRLFIASSSALGKDRNSGSGNYPTLWDTFQSRVVVERGLGNKDVLHYSIKRIHKSPVCLSLLLNSRVTFSDAERVCDPRSKEDSIVEASIRNFATGETRFDASDFEALIRGLTRIDETTSSPKQHLLDINRRDVIPVLSVWGAVVVTTPIVVLQRSARGRVDSGFIEALCRVDNMVADELRQLMSKGGSSPFGDRVTKFIAKTYIDACVGLLQASGTLPGYNGQICGEIETPKSKNAREYVDKILNGYESFDQTDLSDALTGMEPEGKSKSSKFAKQIDLWEKLELSLDSSEEHQGGLQEYTDEESEVAREEFESPHSSVQVEQEKDEDRSLIAYFRELFRLPRFFRPIKAEASIETTDSVAIQPHDMLTEFTALLKTGGSIGGGRMIERIREIFTESIPQQAVSILEHSGDENPEPKTKMVYLEKAIVEHMVDVCTGFLITEAKQVGPRAKRICRREGLNWAEDAISSYIYDSLNNGWMLNPLAVRLFAIQEDVNDSESDVGIGDSPTIKWQKFVEDYDALEQGLDINPAIVDAPQDLCDGMLIAAGMDEELVNDICRMDLEVISLVTKVIDGSEKFGPETFKTVVGIEYKPNSRTHSFVTAWKRVVITRPLIVLAKSARGRVQGGFVHVLAQIDPGVESLWNELVTSNMSRGRIFGTFSRYFSDQFGVLCDDMLAASGHPLDYRKRICHDKGDPRTDKARQNVDKVLNGLEPFITNHSETKSRALGKIDETPLWHNFKSHLLKVVDTTVVPSVIPIIDRSMQLLGDESNGLISVEFFGLIDEETRDQILNSLDLALKAGQEPESARIGFQSSIRAHVLALCNGMLMHVNVGKETSARFCDIKADDPTGIRSYVYGILNNPSSYDASALLERLNTANAVFGTIGENIAEPTVLLWTKFAERHKMPLGERLSAEAVLQPVDNSATVTIALDTIADWSFSQIDHGFVNRILFEELSRLPNRSAIIAKIKSDFITKCESLLVAKGYTRPEIKTICSLRNPRETIPGRKEVFRVLNGASGEVPDPPSSKSSRDTEPHRASPRGSAQSPLDKILKSISTWSEGHIRANFVNRRTDFRTQLLGISTEQEIISAIKERFLKECAIRLKELGNKNNKRICQFKSDSSDGIRAEVFAYLNGDLPAAEHSDGKKKRRA
jgi:hypothetical protein